MPYRTIEQWMEDPLIDKIACVAYTAIRTWCIRTKQEVSPEWTDLPDDYADHIKIVVARAFADMKTPSAKQLHERCLKDGKTAGWGYGAQVDREKKLHPDILPWEQMTMDQRMKDHIFSAVIRAFLEGS